MKVDSKNKWTNPLYSYALLYYKGKNPGFDCVSFADFPLRGRRSGLGGEAESKVTLHCPCLRLLMQRHLIPSHFRPISHFTGQSVKRRSETLTQQHRTGRLCDTSCGRQRLVVCLDQRLGKNVLSQSLNVWNWRWRGEDHQQPDDSFCVTQNLFSAVQPGFLRLNCVQLEPD